MLRSLIPRLGDFLFVCVFASAMLLGQRMLNQDSDVGRHIVMGTYILQSKTIPLLDILSHTLPGARRPPYEWLAQVILAASNQILGLDGVVIVTAALIASAILLSYLAARRAGALPVASFIIAVWAAAASSLHWLTRPHVFSFLFLVIWIWLLERLREEKTRSPWPTTFLMLLWANTHGGFIFGFLAWASYFAGWIWQRAHGLAEWRIGRTLFFVGLGAALASVVTPALWGNWTAVVANRSAYVLSRTTETLPINPALPSTWPFLGLVILALLLAIQNRRNIVPAHAILLTGLGVLGAAMARNVPLFCVAAVPILARWATDLPRVRASSSAPDRAVFNVESQLRGGVWPLASVALAVGLLSAQSLIRHQHEYDFDSGRFPVRAADWLATQALQGKMFNDSNWGGYILYRLWPSQRVFVDSQSDFYGEQFMRQYAAIIDAKEGSDELLAAYDVSWVIVGPKAPIAQSLSSDNGWSMAYDDSTAMIFVRNSVSSKNPTKAGCATCVELP